MEDFSLVDLRVPPEPRYARTVRGAVTVFAQHHQVPDDDLEQFLTALGEAVANAIEHAGTEGLIRVRCRIDDRQIAATIADSGVGFFSTPSPPANLPHPMAEGGRGLPLMRRCSHIFNVRSIPGKGTAVLVGRRLRRVDVSQRRRSA